MEEYQPDKQGRTIGPVWFSMMFRSQSVPLSSGSGPVSVDPAPSDPELLACPMVQPRRGTILEKTHPDWRPPNWIDRSYTAGDG
jgi:hypothetical protein